MDFSRSREFARTLTSLVPGGGHTYAKGADQFPEQSPGILVRGRGCHVWDADGNEFIEYGMGLRAVTLGHAYPRVIEAVQESLEFGTNFTRPAAIEVQCAETFLDIISGAEMVKFTKDGSTADTAALKLARAYTGRDMVAVCDDQPFLSYDDWFISTTTMDAGIPDGARSLTARFAYNDLDSVRAVFAAHPGRIAAIMLEPARVTEPAPGFLQGLQSLCRQHGTVLVFDEIITGFRWHLRGAQGLYGVVPDLSTFGKAMSNGFALSALCGTRELMRLGSRERPQDNVFLLSTTHGAETTALAAAIRTMDIYESEPVVEYLHLQGERLAAGFGAAAIRHGIQDYVGVAGRACNLIYGTRGPDGKPSQAFRTLLLQETVRRGVLMPSLVVSYSHTDADIARTIDALDGAFAVYARALADGVEKHIEGPPSRTVFERR